MEFVVLVVLLAFLALLIAGYAIPIYKDHKKATGGVINYDPSMRKFVYRVNLPYRQILETLQTKNGTDELSCTFEQNVLRISEYGSHRDYYFRVQECDGYCVVRLEQVEAFGMKSSVPYKLNPFMLSKLQAKLLPFSRYGF